MATNKRYSIEASGGTATKPSKRYDHASNSYNKKPIKMEKVDNQFMGHLLHRIGASISEKIWYKTEKKIIQQIEGQLKFPINSIYVRLIENFKR